MTEIMEQPQSLSRALNFGGRFLDNSSAKLGGLDDNRETMLSIRHLILSGCGTVSLTIFPLFHRV